MHQNANAGTKINITGTGTGLFHTLSVAFDGVNKKFVATHMVVQKHR